MADIEGADIEGADVEGADIEGADIEGAGFIIPHTHVIMHHIWVYLENNEHIKMTQLTNPHTHVHACTCVCVRTHVHAPKHALTDARTHKHAQTHALTRTYTRTHARAHTHTQANNTQARTFIQSFTHPYMRINTSAIFEQINSVLLWNNMACAYIQYYVYPTALLSDHCLLC